MKSVFVKLFLLRKYICIFLFCSFYPAMVAAERGGFLYLRFRCYQNPGSKLPSGEICKSGTSKVCWQYFKICISSQYIKEEIEPKMCNIHHQKTHLYVDEDLVCNNPHGSKPYLGIEIKKELLLPLYKTYFVKIEVRNNPWRDNQLIASFGAKFNQLPSANLSQVVYEDVKMQRTELRYANRIVSLDISMGLQCDHDRYGKYCSNSCKPNLEYIKSCTKDGKRICQKGWKGKKCDTKDLCASVSCIESGQCLKIKGKAECWCNNQIGPHCHLNYNPCSKNPCKNEGICSLKKKGEMGYDCQCKHPFSGPQCTNKIDICELEPCKNNASCHHIKPGAFHCKCLKGFHGELCELNIDNANSFNKDFIKYAFHTSSLYVGILVILLVIVFTAHFMTKRYKKEQQDSIVENPMFQDESETELLLGRHSPVQSLDGDTKKYNKMGESNNAIEQHSQPVVPPSLFTLYDSQSQRDDPN